jgi:single-strand DNA-binding protein
MGYCNFVIIMGTIVNDIETKVTKSGVAVLNLRIAVKRKYVNDDKEDTDFFDVVCWRNTAGFVSKYFKKGQPILVKGVMQNRTWTDKEGIKRYSTNIIAEEIEFAGYKKGVG